MNDFIRDQLCEAIEQIIEALQQRDIVKVNRVFDNFMDDDQIPVIAKDELVAIINRTTIRAHVKTN